MKYWVSTSGGVASAISAIIAHENNLPFEMIFADTKIENPDLYRFIWDVATALDKQLIWLVDGRNPWQVFVDRKFIGNTRTAHCSEILKTDKVFEYLDVHANFYDPIVLGMDSSEQDRIDRAQKKWAPRPVVSLINSYKVWRPEWDDILTRYNIVKPLLYSFGFPHNNCGGMCVRAGLKQFATLLENFRSLFLWHEEWQEWAMQEIGPTARPFLRRTVNKQIEYMTMREFRLLYDAGKIDIEPYDYGGCACFVD